MATQGLRRLEIRNGEKKMLTFFKSEPSSACQGLSVKVVQSSAAQWNVFVHVADLENFIRFTIWNLNSILLIDLTFFCWGELKSNEISGKQSAACLVWRTRKWTWPCFPHDCTSFKSAANRTSRQEVPFERREAVDFYLINYVNSFIHICRRLLTH